VHENHLPHFAGQSSYHIESELGAPPETSSTGWRLLCQYRVQLIEDNYRVAALLLDAEE